MIAQIAFIFCGISKKHTFYSFGLQFGAIIRLKKRKTSTSKNLKMCNNWGGFK
jgi:hypothetical protein